MTSLWASFRTLVVNLVALAYAILVVLGHQALQPFLRVVAYLRPAPPLPDVEAAPQPQPALKQKVAAAFHVTPNDSTDEDLSELVSPVPRVVIQPRPKLHLELHGTVAARLEAVSAQLENWVSVSGIPLPSPDASEDEALKTGSEGTRVPLWLRRRLSKGSRRPVPQHGFRVHVPLFKYLGGRLSKESPAKEDDKLPAARSTRDDQQSESDGDGWSSEDLGIDASDEASSE